MTTGRDHDEGSVELIVRPWDRPGEAKLYVKPDREKQLDELLTAAGISHGRVYEFHYEPIYVAIAISVGGPAAWKALARIIPAFLQRNDRKSVKVNMKGESVEFAAYSARQVEHMIRRMASCISSNSSGGKSSPAGITRRLVRWGRRLVRWSLGRSGPTCRGGLELRCL